MSKTITLYDTATADDIWLSLVEPNFQLNGQALVGYITASRPDVGCGVIFRNVTVPPRVTIVSAYLSIRSWQTKTNTTVNTRIRAEQNISPANWSNSGDFATRTWTTNKVNWDAIPAWTDGTVYTSPNIATVIQEVINLPGWTSGNPMAILWDDFEQRSTQSNNTVRQGYNYATDTSKPMALAITYENLYPTDALSRVTGLIHRWRPGLYTLEMFLGETKTEWPAFYNIIRPPTVNAPSAVDFVPNGPPEVMPPVQPPPGGFPISFGDPVTPPVEPSPFGGGQSGGGGASGSYGSSIPRSDPSLPPGYEYGEYGQVVPINDPSGMGQQNNITNQTGINPVLGVGTQYLLDAINKARDKKKYGGK